MFAGERRIVCVKVMAIVVAMQMIVLDRFVRVTMPVSLAGVEVDPEPEQRSCRDRKRTGVPVAKCPRESGPDERCERKDRARATRSDAALREQVEIQARAVAGRAARKEDR